MAEKVSAGQADKAAVEERTAKVAQDDRRQQEQQQVDTGKPDADSAAERVADATPAQADRVTVDPYPGYEGKTLADLRALAEQRGVEINRDVEKSHLVAQFRAADPRRADLDFMTLESLRSAANDAGLDLDPEFERAQLVTELRAADTGH